MNKKENPADQNSYPIVDQFNSENLIPILSCGKENIYKHPFCILLKSSLIVVSCGMYPDHKKPRWTELHNPGIGETVFW